MAETSHIANPYKVLDVERDVDDTGLRRAYRAAVKRCHPDHGGDPAEFLVVQEAYEQLSDPQRRADVDYFLDQPSGGSSGTSAGAPGDGYGSGTPAGAGYRPSRDGGSRSRPFTGYRAPTPRQVIDGWLEARCLFECDIRGIGLDQLDQRAESAEAAAETLRGTDSYPEELEDLLATWRDRVREVRHEVMVETTPDELGAKIRRGPANRGLFTDRALAVAFVAAVTALVAAVSGAFGDGGRVQEVGTSPFAAGAAVTLGAIWWGPTWVAGWVRLGWGRRARRAVVASTVAAAVLSAAMWGQWALWGVTVAGVAAVAGGLGWFADRRLRAAFPPPIWGPQRRLRSFRERAAARSEARAAARDARAAERQARRGAGKGRRGGRFL